MAVLGAMALSACGEGAEPAPAPPRTAPVDVPAAFRAPLGVMTSIASGMLFERLPTCDGFAIVGENFHADNWTAFKTEMRRRLTRLDSKGAMTDIVAFETDTSTVTVATDVIGSGRRLTTDWTMRTDRSGNRLDCVEQVAVNEVPA